MSSVQHFFKVETLSLCLGVFVLYLYLKQRRARQLANPKGLPSPPGPKPLPVIGNILDIPREKEAATYYKMAQEYGDLVHMSVLGQNILIINSFQTANELFEKRSSNYSDRNEMPMIKDLMGWDFSFGHMPYGPRWKTHRTMFHRQFQSSVVSSFWPTQLKEAHKLLRKMLRKPNDLINHLRFNSASTIMNVTYGIEISDQDDHYIVVAETALEGMAKAAHPGAFLVDIFPILKYVPDWFPLAGFKKKAKHWRKYVMEMKNAPFESVKQALKQGTATSSFVSNLLNEIDLQKNMNVGKMKRPEEIADLEETVKNCAGLAYAAGAESVVSSLSSFILAMILHPSVQVKARAELDRVVGQGRLPDFSDRGSLPYVDAIVKETLRWSPVAPLGLPHMVTKDDEFRGYHVPAGTMVMGNSWTILHDPSIYPSPLTFNPDRFISPDPSLPDPSEPISVAFGYGRRICPGRFMAEGQLWVSIACILAAFDIGGPVRVGTNSQGQGEGQDVEFGERFKSGMICHPEPFEYDIRVRSEKAKQLVEQTADL
ncbi:cytochrome P450 [Dendrothele bispora CBS 962.96]|uniref:Cytochrome P450 n=1 Tax=Dendrothele bispora (strain CBS 962.96) TaxID=1314807 RepID=A0A4S8MJB4_DENBC|nr:cytochrome P450 [Dendrothele bispora CBS 962.96]